MTALAVHLAGLLHVHHVRAEQRVGEGRLARARGPEQHARTTADDRAEHVDALPRGGADGEHLHPGGDALDVLDEVGQRGGVRDEVGLGEQHERLRPVRLVPGGGDPVAEQCGAGGGGHGQRQEPLQPSEVELDRERDADDDVVDVGGEHLPFGALRRRRAHEGRAAGQERPDELRVAVGVDGHPVTGADDPHRVTGHHERGVRPEGARRGDHVAQTAVHPHHTPRQESLLCVRGEGVGPRVVPAVRSQRVRRSGSLGNGERQGKPFTRAAPATRVRRGGEGRSAGGHRGGNDALRLVGSAHRNDSHQCPHLLVPRTPHTIAGGRPARSTGFPGADSRSGGLGRVGKDIPRTGDTGAQGRVSGG